MAYTLQGCRVVPIPGPPGGDANPGQPGQDGSNAWASLLAAFTMPAQGATGDATFDHADWLALGEPVFIESLGTLRVDNISGLTVTLFNLQDGTGIYPDNAAPGTIAPSTSRVTPSGFNGEPGTPGGSGAPDSANYLLTQANGSLPGAADLGALTSGLLKITVAAGVATPATATPGTDYLDPSTGLEPGDIGTSVQAFNALLAAIAGLAPTVADRMIYATGANTVALATLTAFARSLLDDANAAAARVTLGVLSGYGILGSLTGWDLNSATTDTPITMLSSRYIIDKVQVENPSTNLTLATGGLFTAAGGGPVVLAADQALSALNASTKFLNLVLEAITGTDVVTAGTLYARCGTDQGGVATANLRIWGWKLD